MKTMLSSKGRILKLFFICLFLGMFYGLFKTEITATCTQVKNAIAPDEYKIVDIPVTATKLLADNNPNRLVPIYRVATEEKKIAISFDAAWGADKTPDILNILNQYNVKTTFFLVKFWAERYPEMVKEINERGHEIGNHSASHPDMTQLSEEQILQELSSTHETIAAISGQNPKLFRPPFGAYNNRLIESAEKAGYMTIQWSVDSLDWRDLGAEVIANRVLKSIRPGDIVLFHNNGKHTVKAVDIILKNLRSQGYEIVPISQLLLKEDYEIDRTTGEQRPKEQQNE
jgi:polysaccharide deacetylase family sporulation protein PdaB